jgi:hypothetical protein
LQNAELENEATKVVIKNKVNAVQQELKSFVIQSNYITSIVKDYSALLKAEERKFFLGESSLFLVNSRESKLIETKLKAIEIENAYFNSKANLFKAAVIAINQ